MMGKIYKKVLSGGLHHEFTQLENGNWLMDSELPNAKTSEDYLIELDKDTGLPVRDWHLTDSFPLKEFKGVAPSYNTEDWAHINAFVQIPGEDAVLLSPFNQPGVWKLNLGTNKIEWMFGSDDPNYKPELKRLTPVMRDETGRLVKVDDWWTGQGNRPIDWNDPDDPYFQQEKVPFEYPGGTHAVTLTPSGDILVLDNGSKRSKDFDIAIQWGKPEYYDRHYARAVLYRYDEEAGTVEELWQYGKERGADTYASFVSDVDYLGEGHYLIDFGGIRGKDGQSPKSHIIEYADGQVINDMKLVTNWYRAERIAPYDNVPGSGYALGTTPGVQIGTLLTERFAPTDPAKHTVDLTLGSCLLLVDGRTVVSDVRPLMKNDRILLPVRATAEALGAKVSYAKDGTVTIAKGDHKVQLTIGETSYRVGDQKASLDVAPYIEAGRTMVPLRFVSEGLGAQITPTKTDGTVTGARLSQAK